MGRAKELQIQEQDYRPLATEILQEIGAIKYDYVDHIYYDTGKFAEEEIYGLTTKKFKEKCPNDKDFKIFNKVVHDIFNECCYQPNKDE